VTQFELSIEIGRTPEDVYAYLADPGNLPDWQGEVVEIRGATGGPLPVGAEFTEVRVFLGKRIESTLEVTASEPGREFSLRTRSGPVPFAVRHVLEPAGEGRTRLTLIGEAQNTGMFKLAGPLVVRAAQRRTKGDFERLRRTLES
jgi:uncharacterized protein YndB with AHSA1/START domain